MDVEDNFGREVKVNLGPGSLDVKATLGKLKV
jgi:hypothetical protein